jgi:metal-responsive CopG/Arc/MetJ family transcriptional regulator
MAKVKIDGELWERVKQAAQAAGYSSPEEFVTHALEKELSTREGEADEEEIKKRLQGLGYIS